MNQIRKTYLSRFPLHAFATDELTHGIRMYPLEIAIAKAIVQHNYKHSLSWMVYDIDREQVAIDWDDRNAPPPNIIAINPTNGHGHYFYGLEAPIHNYIGASEKALRYMAVVDTALTDKLGADPGYSKLMSKNPLHKRWITLYPNLRLYDLDELADWLDLEKYNDRRKRLPNYGYGRNCTLFETLRPWAYRKRRTPYLSAEFFYGDVLSQAMIINAGFNPPLPHSEVRSTAKSVSQWTWRRMSAEGFSSYQSRLGKLSGAKRTEKAMELRKLVIEAREQCPELTQGDLAAMLGINQGTVSRHLRDYARTISDNRLS